jgi:hypothetical protein
VSGFTVGVEGLRDLNRSLRQLDSEAPKALRGALNEAAELLIRYARPDIPRRTGNAAASLKAQSTRTAVRIKVGGRKAPYFPWLDFGGKTGPNRSVDRPFLKEGRYLYPNLRKHRDEFTALLRTSLDTVAENAGLEVD